MFAGEEVARQIDEGDVGTDHLLETYFQEGVDGDLGGGVIAIEIAGAVIAAAAIQQFVSEDPMLRSKMPCRPMKISLIAGDRGGGVVPSEAAPLQAGRMKLDRCLVCMLLNGPHSSGGDDGLPGADVQGTG